MHALADVLQYVNIVAFGILALVCFRTWRARRGSASFWAFATFGLLAAVAIAGPVVDAFGETPLWVSKTIVALVVLFPYFLYRFASSFGQPARWVEAAAGAATVGLVVWSPLLPDIPEEGEPRTAAFTAFVVAVLVQWTAPRRSPSSSRSGSGVPDAVSPPWCGTGCACSASAPLR